AERSGSQVKAGKIRASGGLKLAAPRSLRSGAWPLTQFSGSAGQLRRPLAYRRPNSLAGGECMRAVALAAAGLVVLAIAGLGLAQAPVPIIPPPPPLTGMPAAELPLPGGADVSQPLQPVERP